MILLASVFVLWAFLFAGIWWDTRRFERAARASRERHYREIDDYASPAVSVIPFHRRHGQAARADQRSA